MSARVQYVIHQYDTFFLQLFEVAVKFDLTLLGSAFVEALF
jgi:hypothetical protein